MVQWIKSNLVLILAWKTHGIPTLSRNKKHWFLPSSVSLLAGERGGGGSWKRMNELEKSGFLDCFLVNSAHIYWARHLLTSYWAPCWRYPASKDTTLSSGRPNLRKKTKPQPQGFQLEQRECWYMVIDSDIKMEPGNRARNRYTITE